MKQITSVLRIAALVLAGVLTFSCTELNKIPGQAGNDEGTGIGIEVGTVTLTTTVGLEGSPATRALDATGQKTFSANDEIAIIYKNMSDQTVKVVHTIDAADISGNGKYAKITVTLDSPEPNGALRLIYPAAMAKTTIDAGAEINDDYTVNFAALNAQDGKLETLASNYDLTTFDGQFTSDGQLPASITLTNRLAILELTAQNYAETTLEALTSLTISDGTNTYTVTPASPATTLSGLVLVAVKPVSSEKTITVTATESSLYSYTKTVTNRALAEGNIYPVTVRLQRIINLAQLTAADCDEDGFKAKDGDILQNTLGSPVKISIAAGAEVTLDGMAINGIDNSSYTWAGLTCEGNATIVLADGTENTVTGFHFHHPGIFISAEKTLTIQGNTGSLTVAANKNPSYHSQGAAAIGVSYDHNAGNIVIQGGKIIANGGIKGAGIGGGYKGGEHRNCGSITISGGDVTATGGAYAAGIGAGEDSIAGDITISGGKVKATGGDGAAGIGSGGDSHEGNYISSCGKIIIEGKASVEAYGGTNAAAIGSGRQASCGDIIISGEADVTAVAESTTGGAGIGTGLGAFFENCGNISISTSGTVVATGGNDGAGIGSGGSDHYSGKCGNITISAGTITATGSDNAAGIGLAAGGRACGNITITDGVTRVTATKGNSNNQNCIGFGNNAHLQGNNISLGTITIDNIAIVFNKSSQPSYKPEDYSFDHLNSSLSTDERTWTLTKKNTN